VHFYEGHVRDTDPRIRGHRAAVLFEELVTIVRGLQARGLHVEEVVTSGTPTFRASLAFPALRDLAEARHRVSPGTVVYHDAASDAFEDLDLEPAAVVLTRVISHPGPRIVTCDAGSKSVAAEAGDPCAIVLGHPALVARRPSEEHLPFDVAAGERPARGDVLALVPRHVCPTVNLAEEAVLVEGGRIVMTVPVAARAHETWGQ
jgi:D-serine deaminase-like pyridoxal phosphate-dependent protein